MGYSYFINVCIDEKSAKDTRLVESIVTTYHIVKANQDGFPALGQEVQNRYGMWMDPASPRLANDVKGLAKRLGLFASLFPCKFMFYYIAFDGDVLYIIKERAGRLELTDRFGIDDVKLPPPFSNLFTLVNFTRIQPKCDGFEDITCCFG